MKCSLVLVALAFLTPALEAQESSALPVLPGADWVVIQPEAVEDGEAYQSFADVFEGPASDGWKASDIYRSYPDPEQRVLTYEGLRSQVQALRDRLAFSTRFQEYNGERVRGQLLAELDRILEASDRLADIDGELTFEHVKSFIDDRFQPVPGNWMGIEVEQPDGSSEVVDLATDAAFFSNLPTQVVFRVDRSFPGPIATWGSWRYYTTVEQAIEFRTVVAHVLDIFAAFQVPRWKDTSHRLAEIDSAWENYLERGFSQYPWESLLNSHVTDFAWDRPPESQWVLLHPELSLILDVRSSRDASMEPGVLLHGLGYVRYFGGCRDWFAGLSASGSVTGDSSFGLGYGATLHFGHAKIHSRVPHVSLSVLWHDFENGDRGPVIGMSVDLGRLFGDGGEDHFRSRLERKDTASGMR